MYRRTPIFFRIADSFFRHQLLFWGALLIVSGLTMAALYARSKTFHATAMTQVQQDTVGTITGLGGSDGNNWITPAQKNTDHFSEMVKQNQPGGFLDTALQHAHLAHPINVDPQVDDPRSAMLQKNLFANPESANQFSINLTWDNQAETAAIVTALQNQYIAEVGSDRGIAALQSVHFLDAQIGITKVSLHQAEKALSDFRASNGGQLSDAESFYTNQLSALKAELLEKEATSGENASNKVILEQQLAQMKPMSVTEQTVSNQSPLEREIGSLSAMRDSQLASGRTPQHPAVVALDARIAALKKQSLNAGSPENQHDTQQKLAENPEYQRLKMQVAQAGNAQVAEEKEMQALRSQIAQFQKSADQIPAAQRQLSDKVRDYQILQDEYNDFKKRRHTLQVQADLDRMSASSSLLPIGVTYALPTTGRTKLIAMLFGSLFLGCLVGCILVILSEWADHSLRHEADAERLLGVPILAALPEAADLRAAPARRALTGPGRSLPEPALEG